MEITFILRGVKCNITYDAFSTGNLRPFELMDKFVPQEPGIFEEDVRFQVACLQTKGFNLIGQDFFDALESACKKHISIYDRLIDSDLYSLTDCTVQILYAIQAYDKITLKDLYKHLVWDMMQKFEDKIYEASRWGNSKMNIRNFFDSYM